MKRAIIILITIFTYSNLFSQIFVGYNVHKEVISTAKKQNYIDSLNMVNLLQDYPFIKNEKKGIFPKTRIQGIYLAFEKTNETHQEIIHKISYFPLDSIGENSFFLIDERNTNFNNKKKYYKRIEVLKNKILDYVIVKDSILIKGGFLYKKWINYNIYEYLPGIVFREFNKKTISNVGFISMNPFERTISQYNNFNYKSDIYLDGFTENSHPKISTGDDRNGNASYKIGFTPFTNYLPPTNKNHNKYGGYLRKCESINPQKYYSIFVRYIGDNIIRKAHSIKYKKEEILLPNNYRNYKYNRKYKTFNGIEIDTISNFLYECTFSINKNGIPISKIEDNIRIISFRYKDTFYSAIETIDGSYGHMRGLLDFDKLFFIEQYKKTNKCDSLLTKIEKLYLKKLETFLLKELKYIKISNETDKYRKRLQFERNGKSFLIEPYYDITTLNVGWYTIYTPKHHFLANNNGYSLNIDIEYFPYVSYGRPSNGYKSDDEYDKLIKKKYLKILKKFNKDICKIFKGSFKDDKCKCECDNN